MGAAGLHKPTSVSALVASSLSVHLAAIAFFSLAGRRQSLSYLFYCERLFKNGLRTTLPTSFQQGRAGVGGVDDDRHVLAGCPLAVSDGSEHGFARDVRQADVEKNAVVVLLGGQFQGFIAGIRKINLKSQFFEVEAVYFLHNVVVLDQQRFFERFSVSIHRISPYQILTHLQRKTSGVK